MADVLGFEIEWFDSVSGLQKIMLLKFFMLDNTIEIMNEKSFFLKRISYPDLRLVDLFIGNSVAIFKRVWTIKKYANKATENYMKSRETRFICVLKEKNSSSIGQLLTIAKTANLSTGRVKTTAISFPSGLDLRIDAGDILIELLGVCNIPFNQFFDSLTTIEVSCSIASYETITEIFSNSRPIRVNGNVTLCLIKPHILKGLDCGEVLASISSAGFKIGAVFGIHMTSEIAEEIFDVYSGVYSLHSKMMQQLCSGCSLAVMIVGDNDSDIVSLFRDFTGPFQPEIARTLRPKTLRAIFGIDETQNAIHCTDLPDDGEMECRYFFEILSGL